MTPVSGRHSKSVKHAVPSLAPAEAKALLTELTGNRVALRDARRRLEALEDEYPKGAGFQAEDIGIAFELKAKIRQYQAKDEVLTAQVAQQGLRDPRDATSFYVGIVPSIDWPFVASVRLSLGYESYVDRDTGKRIRGPFFGNTYDSVFAEAGYAGSKREHGVLWGASPVPYGELGHHPVYGSLVEVEAQGVATLGVGSEGFVEGGLCLIRSGPFGLGIEGSVGDPRLARVTRPVAEKMERAKQKVMHPRQKHEAPAPTPAPAIPPGRHRVK